MTLLTPYRTSSDPELDRLAAHFAGTGPDGSTCGDCRHLSKSLRCEMYAYLTAGRLKSWPRIEKSAAACKYFEPRGE